MMRLVMRDMLYMSAVINWNDTTNNWVVREIEKPSDKMSCNLPVITTSQWVSISSCNEFPIACSTYLTSENENSDLICYVTTLSSHLNARTFKMSRAGLLDPLCTVMTFNNLLVIYCDTKFTTKHEKQKALIESCLDIPGDRHHNIVFPHQFSDEFVWTAQWQRSKSWQVGQGCKERCKMNTLMGLVVDLRVKCNHNIFLTNQERLISGRQSIVW